MQFQTPLTWNYDLVGYQYPAMVRNARYANESYMNFAATVLARQASMATQIVTIKVPFWADVFAGDVVVIGEQKTLGRIGLFTVMRMESEVSVRNHESTGEPVYQDCYSWLTCRPIENSMPISVGGGGGNVGGGGTGNGGGGGTGTIGGGGLGNGGHYPPPDAGL